MTNPQMPIKAIPSSQASQEIYHPETFILFYIKGPSHQVMSKHFVFAGSVRDAIERGKRHCEQMSYRFIRVQPFFSNLEDDERRNAQQS